MFIIIKKKKILIKIPFFEKYFPLKSLKSSISYLLNKRVEDDDDVEDDDGLIFDFKEDNELLLLLLLISDCFKKSFSILYIEFNVYMKVILYINILFIIFYIIIYINYLLSSFIFCLLSVIKFKHKSYY